MSNTEKLTYIQREVDRVKRDVSITFTTTILSSCRRGLEGISRNPILAIREALLFPEDIGILSKLLKFDLESPGIENMPKACIRTSKFLSDIAENTIRTILFKKENGIELSKEEQFILTDLEEIKITNENSLKNIKSAIKNHFIIPDEKIETAKPYSNTNNETGAKKSPKLTPEDLMDILIARKSRITRDRIAAAKKITISDVADIENRFMLNNNCEVIDKPQE